MSDSIPNPVEVANQRIEASRNRYETALHAMQAGVALDAEAGDPSCTPKHLRVGVNSALVDSGALATLLIAKRLITTVEYYEALAEAAEKERDRYVAHLQARYPGSRITLV